MADALPSALFYLGVPLIGALVAFRWGWKGGLIFIALGVAGLVAFWAILSLLAYLEFGASDPEFRFTFGAGLVMVAGFGSLVWTMLAGLGGFFGLFARLFIARKSA
jgi:hypothetical protein